MGAFAILLEFFNGLVGIGNLFLLCIYLFALFVVATYAKSQGKSPVNFGATDLVCCRTLQGHTGKVNCKFY